MPLTQPTNFSAITADGGTPQIFGGSTASPSYGDPVPVARLASVQATAAASTDTSVALPYGARIVGIKSLQNVAPTGTTATLAAGSTQGGTDIAAALDVKTAVQTVIPLALNAALPLTVANFASIVATSAGGSTIWLRLAQTGATAVGTLTVVIDYVMA